MTISEFRQLKVGDRIRVRGMERTIVRVEYEFLRDDSNRYVMENGEPVTPV
jgi:hypothetical protein